jgi:endonuclease/exonuclease/phosphatase (EEP) superfamily protein YafD
MSSFLTLMGRRALDVGLALAASGAVVPWLGRWSAVADLLAHFLIQLALATFLLLLGLLLARCWRRACLALSCLLLQLLTLDPRPVGGAVAAVPRARVLALNVWIDNERHDAVVDYVRRSDADVVVLVEVLDGWRIRLETLADIYPHRVDCLERPGCDVVILARHPIHATRATSDPFTGAPYVEARLIVGGRPLTVAGTHLIRPIGEGSLAAQRRQLRYVAGRLAEATGPRLLLGDLNAVGWGQAVRGFTELSGFRVVPTLEGTWPAQLPAPLRIPIDQALASPEVAAVTRHNGPFVGSDHLPVIVELGLPSGA